MLTLEEIDNVLAECQQEYDRAIPVFMDYKRTGADIIDKARMRIRTKWAQSENVATICKTGLPCPPLDVVPGQERRPGQIDTHPDSAPGPIWLAATP